MKYLNPFVAVPYIGMLDEPDENGNTTSRNWLQCKFKGLVDHRAVKKNIRKAIAHYVQRRISTAELREVIRCRRIHHDGIVTNKGLITD